MKVYRGFSDYYPVNNAVVTTGIFDGVHVGHKTIINRLKRIAQKHNGESVLITFHPHPRLVLQKNKEHLLLELHFYLLSCHVQELIVNRNC